jgi:threonine dehydrogenase-like Zn-dependent dehydrogenase
MRALCWHGKADIRCDTVPDPRIEAPRDAIVKVTSCAICGSDLHLYDGLMPGMESGDIMGHEFMGEVVEVGRENTKLKVGDRVVVPFTIICGECEQCRRGNYSACERSNRNKEMADKVFGHTTAGLYGYAHLTGGYPGGQAEYVRVPYADVGPVKVPSELSDEQVLFLSDIFPTGWQAVVQCDLQPSGSCRAPRRRRPAPTARPPAGTRTSSRAAHAGDRYPALRPAWPGRTSNRRWRSRAPPCRPHRCICPAPCRR